MNFTPLFEREEEGCVHGRFQPPHNGHREYILAAKAHCNFLWVGITRYDLLRAGNCEVAPHRSDPGANPLTYFERITLLSKMLVGEGIPAASFGFIPFPVDEPVHLKQFLPTTVTCFTTIYEDWNREKIRVLESAGYKVNVLWERTLAEKRFSGSKIREAIRRGESGWEVEVPPALVQDIKKARIDLRMA